MRPFGLYRIAFAAIALVFCAQAAACTGLPGIGQGRAARYDYPPPPRIGTDEQQQRLADLARRTTSEDNDDNRAPMLVELAAQMWSMLPERYADDNYDELAGFVAETALISFIKRQYGSDAARPEVWALSTKVPGELNGLRITAPKYWTVPGAVLIARESTVIGRALEHADVLERNGQGAGRYENAAVFFNEENLRRLEQEDVFDPFIKALYSNNRMAAARLCLAAERARGPRLPREERVAEQRRVSAVLHEIREIEALVLRREDLRYLVASVSGEMSPAQRERDAIAALDEPIREGLLRLARHPDWAVHLYIWRAFATVPAWQTPELLEAVRAHQNPITLRFFEGLEPDATTHPGTGN